jgi:hypothetical protein
MPPAPHCRHCNAPLDDLAHRRANRVCGAAACRHAEDRARLAQAQQAAVESARAAARSLNPQAGQAPVVWLQHTHTALVAISDEDRRAHRQALQELATEGRALDLSQLAAPSARDGQAQGARLCGHCGGHCCMHGAGWHAFIDVTLLQQVVEEAPGTTLADAVQHYVDLLPAAHVHGSCLYHGAGGCAMPRERRSGVCNGFACPALEAVQDAVQAEPDGAVIALTLERDAVVRAALITPAATRFLPLAGTQGG